MIAKPCPECGREDAGCGCPCYWVGVCRGCGEKVPTFFEPGPVESCHKCTPSEEWVPLSEI